MKKFNKNPVLWTVRVLTPALVSALIFSSCTGSSVDTFSSAEKVSSVTSSSGESVDSSLSVSETASETETESSLSSSSESGKKTEMTTTEKITEAETTEKSGTTESTTKRPSVTDLFTTKSRTTERATNSDGSVDFSCFDNSAFVGNSRLLACGNYGFAKNVYAKIGLNVNTVYTDSCEGGSGPVIDELNGKKFDKVFLMFGDNECGWGSMSAFKNQYKNVIESVKSRVPGAKIYLISVLPISKSKSQQKEYDYTKTNIDKINEIIKQVADDENVTFLNAASSIAGNDGYLPDEASTDGCHLGKKYTKIWMEYVAKHM